MANVFDVAKYILEKQGTISTWKLQKLCYYSQAWALAWSDGVPLFDDDFQAWSNGPVCETLYNAHKGKYLIEPVEFLHGDTSNLTEDEIDTINTVLESYGDKTPFWLREQSHEEAPWRDARGVLPEYARSRNTITKDSMGIYYGGL